MLKYHFPGAMIVAPMDILGPTLKFAHAVKLCAYSEDQTTCTLTSQGAMFSHGSVGSLWFPRFKGRGAQVWVCVY